MMLTQKKLKDLFTYDPNTGNFYRNTNVSHQKKGNIAGYKNINGYIHIKIDSKNYNAHRLAWLYMTGNFPKQFIDHVNGIRSDNKWINLREACIAENNRNRKNQRNNTTGFKGVTKKGNYIFARINFNKVRYYLGYFKTAEEAHKAYQEAAQRLHGEFARIN